ncbi:hypothetical protein DFH09DRAFT_1338229 [Mycena vulgaris]|nr:hypothetical protein DFH09DRAFT_1338229 [Mycena vulgaris]
MFSRISAVRRLPQLTVVPRRFTSSINVGLCRHIQGLQKEKAHETALLHKLKADIEKKKTELEQLEKEHEAELSKAGRQ